MDKSVNDYVEMMEQEFFNQTGESSDCAGDLGLRFKVLATQLYSLSCLGDYILKQAFPQTAQGQYLDMHAEINALERKTDGFAKGLLVFSVEEEATEKLLIPKGTIVSCKGKNYLRFATDEDTQINPGRTKGAAYATALGSGEEYNAPANEITVMVTPPAGVGAVTNTAAFKGGANDETDSALRARLLAEMGNFPNGWNCQTFIHRAMVKSDVLDANAFVREESGKKQIVLALKTKSGEISPELARALENEFYEASLVPFEIIFKAAAAKEVKVKVVVFVHNGYDTQSVLSEVQGAVEKHISSLKISQSLSAVNLGREISKIAGVRDYVLESPREIWGAGDNQYIVCTQPEVTSDEW